MEAGARRGREAGLTIRLQPLTTDDTSRLGEFWSVHWAGPEIVVHGEMILPEQVQGFATEDWGGLVTYRIRNSDCEIVSLDSLDHGRGIGTALLGAVVDKARARGCSRLVLTTTNDNLRALGFYQKRGFTLIKVRPGAVHEARKLKPAIPEIGENGIPLRDEIDLEMKL